MKDCYREVTEEFPLLFFTVPDKYDCNKLHVLTYTELVVWISDLLL